MWLRKIWGILDSNYNIVSNFSWKKFCFIGKRVKCWPKKLTRSQIFRGKQCRNEHARYLALSVAPTCVFIWALSEWSQVNASEWKKCMQDVKRFNWTELIFSTLHHVRLLRVHILAIVLFQFLQLDFCCIVLHSVAFYTTIPVLKTFCYFVACNVLCNCYSVSSSF